MGTQQNFEWRFYDEDGNNDQRWASMQPMTHHTETDSGWQWGRLRTLLVMLPFLALFLWTRPWQSNEVINQPKPVPTLQPMIYLLGTPTPYSTQRGRRNSLEDDANRQALADLQATLTSVYAKTGGYTVTKGNTCFCSCVVLEPSRCISYHADMDAIPRQPISSTATKP